MGAQWGHRLTGFTIAAAYWPGILSAVFVPRWAAIAVLVPLFLMGGSKLKHLPATAWGVLIFLLAAGGLSIVWSPAPLTGAHDLMLAMILAMALVAGSSMGSIDDVFEGMAWGLTGSSAAAVAQSFGWDGVVQSSNGISGFFFNSEILAEFSAMIFVWCVARRKWHLAVLCAAPLFLCQSRIALLTLGAGAVYLAWVRLPRRWSILLGLLGAVGAVSMVIAFGDGKIASAFHRVTLWITASMFVTPFGNGLGWTQVAFPSDRFVHSDMIQMAVEIGLPALAVLYIPWAIIRKKGQDLAAMAVFAGGALQFAVSFPVHFPAQGFVLALVAGHLLGVRPVVCVGIDQRGTEDGDRVQRGVSCAIGASGGGGGIGKAVSV